MACLMQGRSGRYECHQHDSAWHVQGYFYWWVIVSMVWGIIAAFIAIVMPVWEASAWRHHLCAEFPHEPHACMHACLGCSFSRILSPKAAWCMSCVNLCAQARDTIGSIIVHMLTCQSAVPLGESLKKVCLSTTCPNPVILFL